MKKKMRIGEPVIVAQGPEVKEAGWGPYQFPGLAFLTDGRILYSFNAGADSETAYGNRPGVRISADGGYNWVDTTDTELQNSTGCLLLNGDRISFITPPSVPLEGLSLPEPIGKTWLGHSIYRIEEVSREYCDDTWRLRRTAAGSDTAVEERVKLNWPHMITRSVKGVLVCPHPRGRLRIGNDGALWMPHYDLAGTNPKNGGLVPYLCIYLFKSTDYGYTWYLVNWLPYVPDTDIDPMAFEHEGYGENDIAFAPDGTMINLIRTNGCYPKQGPCYIRFSKDAGCTWTALKRFDDKGVWPCLLALECGVTLASYGRPGLYLRATDHPSAMEWDSPVELIAPPQSKTDGIIANNTCSYTNMLPLGSHSALLAYSDWTVKDKAGIPRKSMMVRHISIKE